MKLFPLDNLTKGVFLYREKRFLAHVLVANKKYIAYCPNTGSMKGLLQSNSPILLSRSTGKLPYRWRLVQVNSLATHKATWVNIDTHLSNQVIHFYLEQKMLAPFQHYTCIQREVYFAHSRFDFLLKGHILNEPDLFLEVKNVTFSRHPTIAEFPDARTTRGEKHLKELYLATQNGFKAALLYVISRNDCTQFTIAQDIDPAYNTTHKTILPNVPSYCAYFHVSEKGVVLKQCV